MSVIKPWALGNSGVLRGPPAAPLAACARCFAPGMEGGLLGGDQRPFAVRAGQVSASSWSAAMEREGGRVPTPGVGWGLQPGGFTPSWWARATLAAALLLLSPVEDDAVSEAHEEELSEEDVGDEDDDGAS